MWPRQPTACIVQKSETLPGKAAVITVQPAIVRYCCPCSVEAGYYHSSVQEIKTQPVMSQITNPYR